MPRSAIQDILDHADELAKRFDDFDPDQAERSRSRNTSSNAPSWLVPAANNNCRQRRRGPSRWHVMAEDRRPPRHLSPAAQQRYGTIVEAS